MFILILIFASFATCAVIGVLLLVLAGSLLNAYQHRNSTLGQLLRTSKLFATPRSGSAAAGLPRLWRVKRFVDTSLASLADRMSPRSEHPEPVRSGGSS